MINAISLGWILFWKSLTQIFFNLPDLLKIAGPLYLFLYLSIVGLDYYVPFALQLSIPPPVWVVVIAGLVVMICAWHYWIAVRWHRFVLLKEDGSRIFAALNGARIWAYFKYSFVIMLTVFLGLLAIFIAVSFLVFCISILFGGLFDNGSELSEIFSNPSIFVLVLSVFIGLLISLTLSYLILRISLGLPAVALGLHLNLSDSFILSIPIRGAIFVAGGLAYLMSVTFEVASLGFIAKLEAIHLPGFGEFVIPAIHLLAAAFIIMTAITLLTALYGYLAEQQDRREPNPETN